MENICVWSYDSYMDGWETECGEAFQFTSDGPKENGMRYCCYCGANLKIGVVTSSDDE